MLYNFVHDLAIWDNFCKSEMIPLIIGQNLLILHPIKFSQCQKISFDDCQMKNHFVKKTYKHLYEGIIYFTGLTLFRILHFIAMCFKVNRNISLITG